MVQRTCHGIGRRLYFNLKKKLGLRCSAPVRFYRGRFFRKPRRASIQIASFEAVDLPSLDMQPRLKTANNLDRIANKVIGEAIDAALGAGCSDIVILHCKWISRCPLRL